MTRLGFLTSAALSVAALFFLAVPCRAQYASGQTFAAPGGCATAGCANSSFQSTFSVPSVALAESFDVVDVPVVSNVRVVQRRIQAIPIRQTVFADSFSSFGSGGFGYGGGFGGSSFAADSFSSFGSGGFGYGGGFNRSSNFSSFSNFNSFNGFGGGGFRRGFGLGLGGNRTVNKTKIVTKSRGRFFGF